MLKAVKALFVKPLTGAKGGALLTSIKVIASILANVASRALKVPLMTFDSFQRLGTFDARQSFAKKVLHFVIRPSKIVQHNFVTSLMQIRGSQSQIFVYCIVFYFIIFFF